MNLCGEEETRKNHKRGEGDKRKNGKKKRKGFVANPNDQVQISVVGGFGGNEFINNFLAVHIIWGHGGHNGSCVRMLLPNAVLMCGGFQGDDGLDALWEQIFHGLELLAFTAKELINY